VLGHVVEEVSGMRLSEFFEKEIFKPLGMQDTAFSVPKTKSRRFAALYCSPQDAKLLGVQRVPRGKQALVRIDGNKPEESRWFSGRECKVESGGGMMGRNMGGLVSTLNDCARFLSMLSAGGGLNGTRILQPETVERYCTRDLFPDVITSGKAQRESGIRFGWTALGQIGVPLGPRDVKPSHSQEYEVGEVAGGGAACTYWSFNPDREVATLWFTQSMSNDPYTTKAENLFLAARRTIPKKFRDITGRQLVQKSIKKLKTKGCKHI